jgi:hypothetical protein
MRTAKKRFAQTFARIVGRHNHRENRENRNEQ